MVGLDDLDRWIERLKSIALEIERDPTTDDMDSEDAANMMFTAAALMEERVKALRTSLKQPSSKKSYSS